MNMAATFATWLDIAICIRLLGGIACQSQNITVIDANDSESGQMVFQDRTDGTDPAIFQETGNDSGIWTAMGAAAATTPSHSTVYSSKRNTLQSEEWLGPDDWLVAADRKSFIQMQTDGNLVLYRGSSPQDKQGQLWESGTAGRGQSFLRMQADCNLVIYQGPSPANQKGATWSTATDIDGSCHVVLQNDTNFVVYKDGNDPKWSRMYGNNVCLQKNTLKAGEWLEAGVCMVAANKRSYVYMQKDGNLVVYRGSSPSNNKGMIWQSNTGGQGRSFLIMQTDCNLVIYRGGSPANQSSVTWESNTNVGGPCEAIIQDDTKFVVHKIENVSKWSSGQRKWPSRPKWPRWPFPICG